MFKFHHHYYFESVNHKLIRHHFEEIMKRSEIIKSLNEIGLRDNMEIQHLIIFNF